MKSKFLFTLLALTLVVSSLPLVLQVIFPDRTPGIIFERNPESNSLIRRFSYIAGAVNNPGVYEIDEDTRLYQLVDYAGGFLEEADLDFINKEANLAEVVDDEQHIVIPFLSKEVEVDAAVNSDRIDINNASLSQLIELNGIGESTAQKIIDNRPYSQLQDLTRVPGIGERTLAGLIDYITI